MKWLKKIKKFRKNENGQSFVELALTIPILIILLCSIIDFGWIFSNKMILTYCSREGARYGSVHTTESNPGDFVQARVIAVAPEYIKEGIVVTVSYTDIYRIRSGDIVVEIHYILHPLTPIAGIFFGSQDIELISTCIMKVE